MSGEWGCMGIEVQFEQNGFEEILGMNFYEC